MKATEQHFLSPRPWNEVFEGGFVKKVFSTQIWKMWLQVGQVPFL